MRLSEDGRSGGDTDDNKSEMGYQQTLMYGRYSKSLGDFAKTIEQKKKHRKEIEIQRRRESSTCPW